MRMFAAAIALSLGALPAWAAEPDGLTLPPGFHATIVADGLGNMTRHMAFAGPSRLYVSTERQGKDAPNAGIIALHLDAHHVADKTEHFSTIDNGTAIAVYKGELYTASPSALYRFHLSGNALTPSAPPEIIVDECAGPRRPRVRRQGQSLHGGGRRRKCLRASRHAPHGEIGRAQAVSHP